MRPSSDYCQRFCLFTLPARWLSSMHVHNETPSPTGCASAGMFAKPDRLPINGQPVQHASGERLNRALGKVRKNPKSIQNRFFQYKKAIVKSKGIDGLHTSKTRKSMKRSQSQRGRS